MAPESIPTDGDLEESVALAVLDSAHRGACFDALWASEIYTAGPLLASDGQGVVLPAYSSLERLQADAGNAARAMRCRGRDLLLAEPEALIVINPTAGEGLVFSPEQRRRHLQRLTALPAGGPLLGVPCAPPVGLTDRLSRLFERLPAVRSAYLGSRLVLRDQPQLSVAVDSERGLGDLQDAVGQVTDATLQAHSPLLVQSLQDVPPLPALTAPFYRRGVGIWLRQWLHPSSSGI